MGGRIGLGSTGLGKDTRTAATGAAAGLGGKANDCDGSSVEACETQLHRQAPGGQQSACEGGGDGASSPAAMAACAIAGMSWHRCAADCGAGAILALA